MFLHAALGVRLPTLTDVARMVQKLLRVQGHIRDGDEALTEASALDNAEWVRMDTHTHTHTHKHASASGRTLRKQLMRLVFLRLHCIVALLCVCVHVCVCVCLCRNQERTPYTVRQGCLELQ